MRYLGIFGQKFDKNYVIFEINTFEVAKMQSSMFKKKNKFGTKIALSIFWLEFQKTIVMFEINTRICQNAKFHVKQKIFDFGTKNTLFGYFQAKIWKKKKIIVTLESSTLEFIKNEFLINTLNFGIGFAFSKGLGLGPTLLYKICLAFLWVKLKIQQNKTVSKPTNFLLFCPTLKQHYLPLFCSTVGMVVFPISNS